MLNKIGEKTYKSNPLRKGQMHLHIIFNLNFICYLDIYCDKKKIKKKDRDGKKRKIDVENNEIKNVFNNIFI